MSTGYKATSWARISRDYEDVIIEIRDSIRSESGLVEKTIVFDNMTKLKCRECIKNEEIEFFQYDYYDSNGNIVVKYHSEQHDDSKHQTVTNPFHMHVREDDNDLAASKRLPLPEKLRRIDDILSHIIHGRYLKYAYIED